ncbi:MAG TPA: hypothetical protein ENJ53_01235 [Phaeodactylibacter sp.]|nr:hypothetical protein [Phaeodactylibacter sp.]
MKIIVLGAYGFTGKLVVETLQAQAIDFAVGGRNIEQLKDLALDNSKIELVEMTDAKQVKALVQKYDLFVNCVGPFSETADLILGQVAQQGKSYLDISGEVTFVQNSYLKYHHEAVKNQATIIHACAFESVLANLLGALLVQKIEEIETINTYYLLEKAKPSPGTRLTMKLSKFRNSYFLVDGKHQPITTVAQKEMTLETGENYIGIPYPLPEICFFEWETTAKNIGSYLLLDAAEAKYMKVPTPQKNETKEEVMDVFFKRKPKGPNEKQRKNQHFSLLVEATGKDHFFQKIKINGSDMYGLTAQIIAYFVTIFKQRLAEKKVGVISPSQFLGEKNDFFEKIFNSKI